VAGAVGRGSGDTDDVAPMLMHVLGAGTRCNHVACSARGHPLAGAWQESSACVVGWGLGVGCVLGLLGAQRGALTTQCGVGGRRGVPGLGGDWLLGR
jgi:hypothetical protein